MLRPTIVIAGAVRTAVGRLGGSLRDESPATLGALVIGESIRRAQLSPDCVSSVILGQTRQSTAESNIARVAALRAGIREEAPAFTVHRQCASGLQAIVSGVHEIQNGDASVVVAGGTEILSRAPYYIRDARWGLRMGDTELVDSLTEAGPGAQPHEIYGNLSMGLTAENVAEHYGIARQRQDEYALLSQRRSLASLESGVFADEILPVTVGKKKPVVFSVDEHPRDTTLEQLAKLKPAFKQDGTVTAGNTCGFNDGASTCALMTEDTAERLGAAVQARIVSYAFAAVSPRMMGIGPVPAMNTALARAGLKLDDIDVIELNEAFASQSLAVIDELRLDMGRTNPNGGAIGLGHPIAATGPVILTKLLYELGRRKARYGAVTMCVGGGQGVAMIVERL